jgi:hypothetical protein
MRIKNITFLVVGLYMCWQTAPAQSLDPVNLQYIPPSASASSLGKFGEIPVGLYTGIPSISIPIYHYQGISNRLSLDVGLAYHAGGIRVEEIGGNIGMGWALDAGGVISRTLRGQPDDDPVVGYLALGLTDRPSTDPDSINTDQVYYQNFWDTEQDVFSYNFNGHSGRFILDPHGNPVLVDGSNIRIRPLPDPGGLNGMPYLGFMVTDERGIEYIFKDAERTNVSLIAGLGAQYSSSWYLSAMVNPFSTDTIRFAYNIASETYQTFGTETWKNKALNDTRFDVSPTIINSMPYEYVVNAKKLKHIVCPNGVMLDFSYAPVTRCDLLGDSILTGITQTDSLTGISKNFQLYQTYYNGVHTALTSGPCNPTTTGNSFSLRLRLDSVKEISGGIVNPPYVFTYNDAVLLPARNSKQQDLWGYFNGSLNPGTTLVPNLLQNDIINNVTYFLGGADRRVDPTDAGAGALTQIKYPTGGSTTYTFEVNRAGDNQLIQAVPVNNSAVFNFTRNTPPIFGDDSTSGSTTMTIDKSPPTTFVDFNFTFGGWCPGLPESDQITISVKSMDLSTTYVTHTYSFGDNGTLTIPGIDIPNGTYLLIWQINGPAQDVCDEAFAFNLSWTNAKMDSTQLAGGLRIKQIVDYDGLSHGNDMTRQYSYIDSNGLSSGTTGAHTSFGYPYGDCTIIGDPFTGIGQVFINDYLVRTATTNAPLTYTEGSSVGYARVDVATVGPHSVGKEVNYFTSYRDFPVKNQQFNFPFPPTEVLDYALGHPKLKLIYDSAGKLTRREFNDYTFLQNLEDTMIDFKMAMTFNGDCDGDGSVPIVFPPPTTFIDPAYFWFTGFMQKKSSVVTEYAANGDSLTTTAFYAYDPVYFTDVTQTTTIDSKGDTVNSYRYYPFDYTISGSVFGTMTDSNIIGVPVSNEIYKKLSGSWYLTNADAMNYSNFFNGLLPSAHYLLNSAQPVPQSTIGAFNPNALLRNSSLYFLDVSFDDYDAKTNPSQLSDRGKVVNYIWDINRQYPVAEVRNGDSAHIAYSSFEADGNGGWTISGGSLDKTKGLTGRYSYVPSGTISKSGLNSSATYVVSYWTSSGSPITITGTKSGYPITGKTISVGGNSWTYYEYLVTGVTSVSLTSSSNIDELRLYPSSAVMKTYTYIPLAGISSSCDEDNRVTYYEYDLLQRLADIRDQDWNIVKTFQYHYQGQ